MLDGGGSGGSFPSGPTGCARPTPAGRDCIDTAVDLFNLVAAIASESDRSRGAAKCLAAACCIAGAGGGVLYALDRTGTSLVPLASQPDGLSNPVEEALALYPKGQPDMADPRTWTAFTGKPVVLADLAGVAGFALGAIRQRDHRRRFRTVSVLACPLRSSDGVTVGVLELLNMHTPAGSPADPADMETRLPLLQAFAYQAAMIVANLTLRERNRHLLAELNGDNRQIESADRALCQARGSVALCANGLVARSPAMQTVLDMAGKVADRSVTVLMLGETGTGKEVIARLLHASGARCNGPFIAQNCAALPPDLLESELFGHRKGAFTGAIADKKGLFAAAEGGTLFLDEIGDLPLPLQSKLLRVLQDGEVRPLGATEGQRHDVRVIAATNVDLRGRVEAGRFRQDLFYRISVFPIVMPPLRARPEDIDVLVDDFITQFARQHGKPVPGIAPEALAALRRYRFPGNVRELKNVMERAVILCRQGGPIGLEDLPSDVLLDSQAPEAPPALEPTDNHPGVLRSDMKRYEARAIEQALRSSGGNRTRAARSLGLARRTLQEKISRYGLGGQ